MTHPGDTLLMTHGLHAEKEDSLAEVLLQIVSICDAQLKLYCFVASEHLDELACALHIPEHLLSVFCGDIAFSLCIEVIIPWEIRHMSGTHDAHVVTV